ncbi:allergin-1 isoform X1 [Onychomys torridus]|uniref:allergin-1 isoform X1 n=1 Tax=Onychomys torridus TaxID=38674 RepID=UPI00167F80E6|nr:allergin-1 isoform X1 [Onychomys torridus]
MADRGAPVCPSLFSFKGMRSWLDRLLLWAIFLSIALQNAAVDYVREKTGELPSPKLNSSTNVVRMGQNVSLSCSSQNTSLDITYSLFLGTKHIETKKRRGETIIFHLKISNVNETGPYKCKTNVSNLQKYSQELNFMIAKEDSCPSCLLPWLLPGLLLGLLVIIIVLVFLIQPKLKKGNAQRESKSKDSGDAPLQSELYANVCETQTEARQPQELHYITPVFKEVEPRKQEGCVGKPADYVYSELTY